MLGRAAGAWSSQALPGEYVEIGRLICKQRRYLAKNPHVTRKRHFKTYPGVNVKVMHNSSLQAACSGRIKMTHDVKRKEGGWINQPVGPKPMSARISQNNDKWNNPFVRDPLESGNRSFLGGNPKFLGGNCYPLNREQLARHIKKVRNRQYGMPEEENDPEFQITDVKFKNFHGQSAQR
ncbi:Hypothetical protein SCF082_LOCUS38082 [Durusdinium trenchii]|uniref:Uncharacterized protein n=1 Tax=Durusdinium trenchii TaxID=1381693 RepID=A0ABP0PY03_9DINO